MQRNRERLVLALLSNLQWLRLFPFFGEPLEHVRILRGQILVSRTGDEPNMVLRCSNNAHFCLFSRMKMRGPIGRMTTLLSVCSSKNVPVCPSKTSHAHRDHAHMQTTSWTLLQACALRNSSLRKLLEQAPLSPWRLVCAVITRRALTAQGTGALQRGGGEVFGQACDFTCYCAIIPPSTDACTLKLALCLVLWPCCLRWLE